MNTARFLMPIFTLHDFLYLLLDFLLAGFLLDLDRSIHQNTGIESCALVVAFNSISSPKCVKGNQQAFGC